MGIDPASVESSEFSVTVHVAQEADLNILCYGSVGNGYLVCPRRMIFLSHFEVVGAILYSCERVCLVVIGNCCFFDNTPSPRATQVSMPF